MKSNNFSHGEILLEVGKHIHPRQIVSTSVLENSMGKKMHVWSLDDGETVTLTQDQTVQKTITRGPDVLLVGETSWKNWESSKESVEIVVNNAISHGYRLTKTRTSKKIIQLPLVDELF